MCCPYFEPVEPRTRGAGPEAAMLPLGDCWTGACCAAPGAPWDPDESTLRFCNLGYARGACARFPPAGGPDAVRFTVCGDDGVLLRIQYVMERDHHPFAHGVLEYSPGRGRMAQPPADESLRRQAESYARSYLRRRAAGSARFALP